MDRRGLLRSGLEKQRKVIEKEGEMIEEWMVFYLGPNLSSGVAVLFASLAIVYGVTFFFSGLKKAFDNDR